jgi:hypothetical protein
MEISKATMENALPHIEAAERQLEALRFFVANKDRLSLDVRVPLYFNNLVRAVAKMQELFYDDQEFVEMMAQTIAEISKDREYHFTTTKDHDGNIYFDVHGLLPLEKVQSHMLLTGGINEATLTVQGSSFTRDRETT